jgi:hypothetical protein
MWADIVSPDEEEQSSVNVVRHEITTDAPTTTTEPEESTSSTTSRETTSSKPQRSQKRFDRRTNFRTRSQHTNNQQQPTYRILPRGQPLPPQTPTQERKPRSPSNVLYINGFEQMNMEELKQLFSSFGPVQEFNIKKTFGFIVYQEMNDAVNALQDIRKNNTHKLYISYKYNYHPLSASTKP